MQRSKILRYSELKQLSTFEERFKYLKLNGSVAADTFGFDRYLNQQFYRSEEWKKIRSHIIVRDNACDLGIEGYDLYGRIYIHHMNPICIDDISDATEFLLNPDFLICTSFDTHNAIHYGSNEYLNKTIINERTKNDTCPWKH